MISARFRHGSAAPIMHRGLTRMINILTFHALATYHPMAEQIPPFSPTCQLITHVHNQTPF